MIVLWEFPQNVLAHTIQVMDVPMTFGLKHFHGDLDQLPMTGWHEARRRFNIAARTDPDSQDPCVSTWLYG